MTPARMIQTMTPAQREQYLRQIILQHRTDIARLHRNAPTVPQAFVGQRHTGQAPS